MTLKTYLTIMLLGTAICWAAWVVVINSIDPETTNLVGLLLFYSSLFLAIVGASAILGFLVRFILLRQELVFRQVVRAVRQSFLLAAVVVASLIMQSSHLFTWYNALFLIIGLTVLEFFLISYKRV